MFEFFNRVVLTGHSPVYGVFIPPLPSRGSDGPLGFTQVKLGAHQIHSMLRRAKIDAELAHEDRTKLAKDISNNLSSWDLGWFPYRPDKPDAKIETLRIRSTREIEAEGPVNTRPWTPVAFHCWNSPKLPDQRTAVYVSLDARFDFEADWFIKGKPGLVMLQLMSTKAKIDTKGIARLVADIRTKCDKLIVLTNQRFLVAAGFALTDDCSWEQFTSSCVEAIRPVVSKADSEFTKAFSTVDHLLIRNKTTAVVQFHKAASADAKLHYVIKPESQISAASGFLRGYNAIIGASVVAALAQDGPGGDLDDCITTGIAQGLLRMNLFETRGFLDNHNSEPKANVSRGTEVFSLSAKVLEQSASVCSVRVPSARNWCVTHAQIERIRQVRSKDESLAAVARIMGRLIVTQGESEAALEYKIPVTRFGKLTILDRSAYDEIWEIYAAMRNYLATFRRERRPLCLALFGKPGGGKSFAVKELAKSLKSEILPDENVLEVNVSQYRDPTDLAWVFRRVRDITLQGQMPLVFFDEFDATRGSELFGWQKTFLAPMQDGKFGAEPDEIVFQHGIFVFVGGVNHSFDIFSSRFRGRDFIEAKGPDFGSRLVRYLNVLGIVEDPASPDDLGYILRRAVLIRAALQKFQPAIFWDGLKGKAEIDVEVIDWLLSVPDFRHGVRSLEQIIRTCRLPTYRPRFHLAALPPDSQLEMHVDTSQLRSNTGAT